MAKEKTTKKFGNMSTQGLEFTSYILKPKTGETPCLLIGVNKNDTLQKNALSLLAEHPINFYVQPFYEKYLSLFDSNKKIINRLLETLPEGKIQTHIGMNWRAVSSFITQRLEKGLQELLREYSRDCDRLGTYNHADIDAKYNSLDKARGACSPKEETMQLIRLVCAHNLITPEILITGSGMIYSLKENPTPEQYTALKKYTMKAIEQKWKENPLLPLAEVITSITGIKESDLVSIPIKIAFRPFKIEAATYKMLDLFMDALLDIQSK